MMPFCSTKVLLLGLSFREIESERGVQCSVTAVTMSILRACVIAWLILQSSVCCTRRKKSQSERFTSQCNLLFFHPRVTMGERLKRALVAYKKYRLVKRIIAAIVGAAAGIAGCITYAHVYHNYNAAVWAGLSAAFAIVFLRLNFSVRRDYERAITKETFKAYLLIGVLGTVAGFVALITYIALGATRHEKGN